METVTLLRPAFFLLEEVCTFLFTRMPTEKAGSELKEVTVDLF